MHVLTLLASSDNGGGAGGLVSLGLLLMIPLAMYFLMIRPQRRRMKDQQAVRSSLEIGDEVMTNSGIYGFITGFDDERLWLEIDDDVQIRVLRAAVQGKVDTSGKAGGPRTPPPAKAIEAADDASDDSPATDRNE